MEANFGGENHQFFAAGSSKRFGKKAQEWDLNDWKWDGDLFMAAPVDRDPLNCLSKQLFPDIVLSNSSSSCSDETEFGVVGKALGEADKRRRIVAAEDDEQCDDTRSLTLKLGAHSYPVMEQDLNFVGMKNGKRGMVQASNSNHPKCQVENCGSDLSQTKDYHRRHKVCEMHAKASSAVVGNVIQRFCQQCSRFHLLQEFDEGKRSCRRRLAGHNRRRRKTLSDATTPSESSATGDQSAGYLLISLLRVLANLNSDRSEQSKDQEFLSNLLRNIASLAGSSDGNNSSCLLQASQDLQKVGTSAGTAGETSNGLISGSVPTKEIVNSLCSPAKTVFDPAAATNHCASPAVTNCVSPVVAPREIHGHENLSVASFDTTVQATCSERLMLEKNCSADKSRTLCSLQHIRPTALTVADVRKKGFDLNTVYYEEEDGALGGGQPANQATLDIGSSNYPSWILQDSHQSSPPQTSGNTDSTSNRSPSSSNGDAQSRTDRIVLKLFGKDPNDFPLVLRAQIFDWLSNSPTHMESYIRPGCIILTVYLRLEVSMWDELCHDLGSSLKRLLFLSDDDFWRMGWIYARVQHHIAFIYNGQVVLNKSLIMERPICSKIVSVTPIAVPPSSRVTFKMKGFNLVRSTTRLLCAFEGKYLSQEINQPTVQYSDSRSNGNRNEQLQSLSFSCYVPDAIGRGFIEIEDNGFSSGFFPFIVAKEDICAEIKMLESSMNLASSEDLSEEKMEAVRTLGMNFLHEMGWLLRRNQLRSCSESVNSCLETFSLLRFRWILRFAIDHDWSAIVKKFLDILFEGNIETDGRLPTEVALSEDLLHYAVQRNSNSTVKLLLRYKPDKISDGGLNNLFRPDMPGPSGITPLHVAATSSFAESMLNILTDDPAQFGVKAWSNARDTTGFTPEDYARARGHESYILLMQKKINKITEKCDVLVNMPSKLSLPSDAIYKQSEALKSTKIYSLGIDKNKSKQSQTPFCKLCEQHLACRSSVGRSLLYRPMLLSMVGIAAVCVCVGLLFKGPPEVMFVYPPFRWELLESGYI